MDGYYAWMLVATSLVLMMTTPALALFYGGMSRSKSVLNMMMMSFSADGRGRHRLRALGLVDVVRRRDGHRRDGTVRQPVRRVRPRRRRLAAPTSSSAFQLTFAVITAALISGAIADRVKFSAWLVFLPLWVTLSYFPLAHMVWGGGFLGGVEDGLVGLLFGTRRRREVSRSTTPAAPWSTSTPVWPAWCSRSCIGKRLGFGKEPMRPHNLTLTMIGAGLLWFGWFGFNVGSIVFAERRAGGGRGQFMTETGLVWLNTTLATCAAMLGWLLIEKVRDGKATSLGAASGVVAGLVAITPACGALSPGRRDRPRRRRRRACAPWRSA